MSFIGHFVMMHEVTQVASKGTKPSIEPLVRYLKSGKPVNDDVVRFLLALLSPDGHRGVRLKLEQVRGRPPVYSDDVAQEVEAYEEYNELCQTKVTRALCDRYARLLHTPPVRVERQLPKRGKTTDVFTNTVYIIEISKRKKLRLEKARVVPKLAAMALVAARFIRSPDAMRKALRKIDRVYFP